MPLCAHCSAEILETAFTCPKCGLLTPNARRVRLALLCCLIGSLVGGILLILMLSEPSLRFGPFTTFSHLESAERFGFFKWAAWIGTGTTALVMIGAYFWLWRGKP